MEFFGVSPGASCKKSMIAGSGCQGTRDALAQSWSQIGAALGTSKQSAGETHQRWLAEQT